MDDHALCDGSEYLDLFEGEVLIDEGQSFQKGRVLAKLELNEISARVKQAEEGVKKLKRDLVRVQRLYSDRVATPEQVQDLSTALSVAE